MARPSYPSDPTKTQARTCSPLTPFRLAPSYIHVRRGIRADMRGRCAIRGSQIPGQRTSIRARPLDALRGRIGSESARVIALGRRRRIGAIQLRAEHHRAARTRAALEMDRF